LKTIDLVQLVNSTFSDPVREQLSGKFGLSSEMLRGVIAHANPIVIAALIARAATPGGTTALHSTIMSPEANARITEQLMGLSMTTAGVKDLETSGETLFRQGLDRRIAVLSDHIAKQTGIPTQATHALTGMVAAVVFGALRHHVLLEQGVIAQLPALLGHQLPLVAAYVTDGVAVSIGFKNVADFTGSVTARLNAVSDSLKSTAATEGVIAPPLARTVPAPVTSPATAAQSAVRRRVWWLFAVLVAVLAVLAAYVFLGEKHVGFSVMTLPKGAATGAPAGAAALAASGVVTQPLTGASGTGLSSAASTASTMPLTASAGAAASGTITHATLPEPSATQPASPPPAKAVKNTQMIFRVNREGVPTLAATVTTDAEKQSLTDALTRRFGAGHFAADLTVDPETQPADTFTQVDALLPLMALPMAEVKIDGKHVELSGAAADEKLGWRARLQQLFGSSYEVETFDADRAVADATQSFQRAIADMSLAGGSCTGPEVAHVLNLQIVDFAPSSGHVPSSANDNLAKSARLLVACAASNKPVTLEVAAFSDNLGDAQANLQLSKKRADAVRAFLIAAGVPANSLTAQGYGPARPVATNLTSGGRFANRRIEFIVASPS
jgi:outer membrane protein OmpA-like peptidoglycan-associated protein